MHIPYLDSISGSVSIHPGDILALLDHPCELGGDSAFKGKVSTRLYADDRHVLKLKTPFALSAAKATAWCQARLEQERRYAIYLPNRHWLVLQSDDGCALANVSERHPTLDSVLLDRLESGDIDTFCVLLEKFFVRYFDFWQEHQLRQDEGPTNYVLLGEELYYVDDDIYSPDQLVSFAHGLTGLIRRHPAVDERLAERLGGALRRVLGALDTVYPAMLAGHFDAIFVPEARRPVLKRLGEAVCGQGAEPGPSPAPQRPYAPPAAESLRGRRIALLADIHANYPALQAVLRELECEGIDQAIVLGDLVGYGPAPAECLQELRQRPWLYVRGNHDHAAFLGTAGERFNRVARASFAWPLERLNAADRQWLGELPYCWRHDELYAVHGAPADASFMHAYVYAATAEHNLDTLHERGIALCFHGHSHIQGSYFRDRLGVDRFAKGGRIELKTGHRYLVCPGAVGLPRDGSHGAQYALYDDGARSIEFREVAYRRKDFLAAARAAGVPEAVLQMLERP